MQDLKAQAEKLRTDAAECALIRDLATDAKKRELFSRLAEHLLALAREVERAVVSDQDSSTQTQPAGLGSGSPRFPPGSSLSATRS